MLFLAWRALFSVASVHSSWSGGKTYGRSRGAWQKIMQTTEATEDGGGGLRGREDEREIKILRVSA